MDGNGWGAFEIIIRTWPEYENLKHNLETKKGALVNDNAIAISAIKNSANKYFLTDTKTIRESVFRDYLNENQAASATDFS